MSIRDPLAGAGRHRAEIGLWETCEPLPSGFRAAWNEALHDSAHAHFALDLDYLRWEADRGRHARALLIEAPGRRGAIVHRRVGDRWVSGWPWRWQALMCGADPGSPLGMTAADAAWLHEQAARFRGRTDLITYLPHLPARGCSGWLAGATVMQDLRHSDEVLFASMEPSKRRLVRRAREHDFEVATAAGDADRRAFHRLQQESKSRIGLASEATPEQVEHAGESWREWELPWMWLLLARQGDRLLAGVGNGIRHAGTLQGRTAAATLEARRLGASVLLGYEEARMGRDLGHRWLNHGGDTPFKREMSGQLGRRIRIYGWLGGAKGRSLWHQGEAALRNLRPGLARLRRRLGLGSRWTGVFIKLAAFLLPLAADLATGS